MKHILTTFCCLVILSAALVAQEERPVADVFTEKLADMNSDDAGRIKNGQQNWQRSCFQYGAPGQEKNKAEAVALMTEAIQKDENAQARAWLIRQLGRLGDGSCVTAIAEYLGNADRIVRNEAVWALGNIPNNDAGEALKARLAGETDPDRKIALENTLKYRETRKVPTLRSLEEIVKALEGTDKSAWDSNLANLGYLHDVKIATVSNFKDRFAKLGPEAKVLLLDALASARDRSALPLAVEMVKSENDAQKLSAYRAFGLIGDASVLPALIEKIQEGDVLGDTVRDSIRRLHFKDSDDALIAAYEKQTDNGVKVRLIEILRNRRGACAIPVFESALKSNDEGIRQQAIYALEQIGEQTSIPALVTRFSVEENKGLKDAIERAIVQISSRYEDQDSRGEALCDSFNRLPEKEQSVILPIIGKVGGEAARKTVLNTFEAKPGISNELKNAAFQALCNWPDASVAEELYKIATGSDELKARTATRAYIRVVTLRNEGRSAKDSLALFEKAMKIAKSVDDKKFLLVRVETARSMEVFNFVKPYLDDAELEQEACRSVVDMANDHGFYMNNRKEIDPALDKVIEKSKDKNHVDRAKRYKDRR